MSRFNLLEEAWISVVVDDRGTTREVSLKDLFKNAHQYRCLAGETRTQNFALLRVLLAVLHTVYSRFDDSGAVYDQLTLDDRWVPQAEVDIADQEDYKVALIETWVNLWELGKFTESVQNYLEKWRDHFYLFDDKYPFFQVLSTDIASDKISKKEASSVAGKNMNRLISESGNKVALFSPKSDYDNNKSRLNEAEIARWLITYQGYTGLADKVIFGKEKYKSSKGWLFDIGGIYLEGDNLFETLMLNCLLSHPETQYRYTIQKPCWEFTGEEKIDQYFSEKPIDNLAELYTIWSRAIFIDPQFDLSDPFFIQIVKLPDLEHENQFLEPMTLWRFNKKEGYYTPRKHPANQAVWRSFGLVAMPSSYSDEQRRPGVIDWLNKLVEDELIPDKLMTLQAVSMLDDGNATSWLPVDEICDFLNLNDFILTDLEENHWVPRINETVEQTKKVVGFTYRNYLSDLLKIRNKKDTGEMHQQVETLFKQMDQPFREWLRSIEISDSKDKKIVQWYDQLFKIVKNQAEWHVLHASRRDFIGVKEGDQGESFNIISAYNKFYYFLCKELGKN